MVVLRYGHCRSADKIEKPEKILEYNQNEKTSVVLNLQTTEIESKRRQALQYRSIVENMLKWMLRTPLWRATDAVLEYGLI